MQTLVAFAFDEPAPAGRIESGLERVRQWYRPLWKQPPTSHTAAGPSAGPAGHRLGLQLWDHPDQECRWPSWWQRGARVVATLHAPLGWEQLVAEQTLEEAPGALAERLRKRPEGVMRLTAPFVLATVDGEEGRLTLQTDGLGLGRLFEVRTVEGSFWSNRPVAALLFAGARAEADPSAWRRMAACDWPMGDATPYRGVTTVRAATTIEVDDHGHRQRCLDVLSHLVGSRRDPLSDETLSQAAAGLVEVARSSQRLWPGRPVLTLSGGRDSRLVVAAYLAAGIDVTVRTYGGASGEADTARELVRRLQGHQVEHEVVIPSAQRPGARRSDAYTRARRWHDATEGLRPAFYLRNQPPRKLLHLQPALICGVGGEFAHAPGYPDDVERIERLPLTRRLDAFARALQAKVVLPRGISEQALSDVDAQVRSVLEHAARHGAVDAKALDWFYGDERLRRWGMAGETSGRVMPLLAPEFLAAAFGLTTEQSRDSALHSALIARLVPEWEGVDYYSATLKQRQAVKQQRLWQEQDLDVLSGVFEDPVDWGDGFDAGVVQAVWRRALLGRAAARDELLLHRVVWRAAFSDHLAAVNGEPPVRRRRVSVAAAPAPATDLTKLIRSAATRANDLPWARQLARTKVGRSLRRRMGV